MMNGILLELPVGVQDFVAIRRDNMLYVDKTARLIELVTRGHSDVVILFPEHVMVLEFKYSPTGSDIEKLRLEGEKQIVEKNYSKSYNVGNREVISAVIVIDGEKTRGGDVKG